MDSLRYRRIKMAMLGELDKSELNESEKMVLHAALTEQMRKRGLEDYYFFCEHILGYKDLAEMHVELTNFVSKKSKKDRFFRHNLILEPRDTFKTSVVTIGFPLWLMTRDPNIRILIDSEEYTKSKTFLREVKDHLVHNDRYRRVYGKLDADETRQVA